MERQETTTLVSKHRKPAQEHVDPQFLMRWSPRALTDRGVTREHLMAILEAARWAPSSYNEQPWRFVYAVGREDRERLLEGVFEANRAWAKDAPILLVVLAKPTYDRNGKRNPHAWFDTGAAWMSIALQAHKLGLHTHAMGGIDFARVREIVGSGEDLDVVCAVAIGHQDSPDVLPGKMAQMEAPSDRKPLGSIAFEGRIGGHA